MHLFARPLKQALFVLCVLHTFTRPASAAPLYESSFIFEPTRQIRVHSPTIVELPSQKKLLSCWYAGSREMGPDVQIYCSESDLERSRWSEPLVAVASQERHTGDFLKSKSLGNPVLFHDAETKFTYLFFGSVTIGGWRGVRPFYRISKDFGKTWSESIPIDGIFPDGSDTLGRIGKFVRTKPLLLSKDEFLLPLYTEWDDKRSFSCSFKRQGDLFKEASCAVMPGKESLQPSLVLLNGKVEAYTRSKNGFVQHSTMDLNSRQWLPLMNLSLPNPGSSIDTALTSNNEILLVGNISAQNRSSLDLVISTNGLNFKKLFSFELSDNDNDEYSYPSLIKTNDDIYHLVFTHLRTGIKYIRFDGMWLQEQQKAIGIF